MLPGFLNHLGIAYLINPETLQGKNLAISNNEITLERPCCAVFIPNNDNPGLLTVSKSIDVLDFGIHYNIKVEIAVYPRHSKCWLINLVSKKISSYLVKISGNGLLVNNKPEDTVTLPATIDIQAPKGINQGFYFLSVTGKDFLPLKRQIKVGL